MLLATALKFRGEGWAPDDDRWYQNADISDWLARHSMLGIDGQSVFRCGTVLAAVRFLSDAFAVCPPQAFTKTESGRKDDPGHYTQQALRRPTISHTGYRWRHLNMNRAAIWGNSCNWIRGGRTRMVESLEPIHPSKIKVVDQRADGSLVYELQRDGAGPEYVGQAEILHFRGISFDGFSGAPIYSLIRTAVGIALSAEQHAITALTKGHRNSGLLVPTAPMTTEQRDQLVTSYNKAFGGVRGTSQMALLPHGVDVKPLAANNRESQFVELNDQQVGAILRFLGVPGVVVGYMGDKTATYASAKEFFEAGGIKHCVLPWVRNFEEEIDHALIQDGDPHYLRFNLDVLMRANMVDRFNALYQACGRPWLSGNEVREIEDWNPDDDPSMSKVLMPVNMATGEPESEPPPEPGPQDPPPPPSPPPAKDDDDEGQASAKAKQFAHDVAARVVRREITAIIGGNGKGAAQRFATDPEGLKAWAEAYYEKHATHVAGALHIPLAEAGMYSRAQCQAFLDGGVAAVETWEETVVPKLASLALGLESLEAAQ